MSEQECSPRRSRTGAPEARTEGAGAGEPIVPLCPNVEVTKKILIVDDEHGLRATLAANLELEGFTVLEADGVAPALDVLEREAVDLVLSDIRMPGQSGVDLLRHVRQLRPGLPVVLMTAFTTEAQLDAAMDEGVFAVLAKPFDVERAISVLTRALRAPIVLVVDDVRSDAIAIASALRRIGLRCEPAQGGAEALEIVQRAEIDVCVTDLPIPDMDGIELVRRLRALDRTIAVIAMCGPDAVGLVRRATTEGVFGCLRAPVPPRELVRAIARARAATESWRR
jgi:DNA-binding NtrC family response regulator